MTKAAGAAGWLVVAFPFYLGVVGGPLIGRMAFAAGRPFVFCVATVLSLAPLVVLLTLRPARTQARTA